MTTSFSVDPFALFREPRACHPITAKRKIPVPTTDPSLLALHRFFLGQMQTKRCFGGSRLQRVTHFLVDTSLQPLAAQLPPILNTVFFLVGIMSTLY